MPMKKLLSLLLLCSFVCAVEQTSPDDAAVEQTEVMIPTCLMHHKEHLHRLNDELKDDAVTCLLNDITAGNTTTFGTLYKSVKTLNNSTTELSDLKELDEELTTMYRKKHCCCISSTPGNLTVNGTLRATSIIVSGNITTTAGRLVVGSAQVLSGTGSPSGVVTAPQGSLFLRLDGSSTSTRAYINTDGGTTWTALVTVA